MESYTISTKIESLLSPDASLIHETDLIYGLARMPRYLGQTLPELPPYTVGEHCVRCARKANKTVRPYALLHDAAEVYIGDMTSPVKAALRAKEPQLLARWYALEHAWLAAIHAAFGLGEPQRFRSHIKTIDLRMLATEMRDLTHAPATHSYLEGIVPYNDTIVPWDFPEVVNALREEFYLLNVRRHKS